MAKQGAKGGAPFKVVSGEAIAVSEEYLALCKKLGREIHAVTQLVLKQI